MMSDNNIYSNLFTIEITNFKKVVQKQIYIFNRKLLINKNMSFKFQNPISAQLSFQVFSPHNVWTNL